MSTSSGAGPLPGSQTLSRGIRALEILADAEEPLSIAELAEALAVHRSVAYRIVRTLEEHRLVSRDAAGLLSLGMQMAVLARSVSRGMQSAAMPVLGAVAAELGLTTFIAALDGAEVVTLVSVEPAHTLVQVAQRPGTRHSLLSGAPGQAIRSHLSAAEIRALPAGLSVIAEPLPAGYALSGSEVVEGLFSVAVPLRLPGFAPAALAVVYVGDAVPEWAIAARLKLAAEEVRSNLG